MMTTPYLPEAHERVQRDLMESEREQRRTAEKLARELVKVLQEVAILLDGARLESLRRLDPRCPGYWTPEEWRQFFARVPAPAAGSSWGQAEGLRVSELERTIAELKKRLADTEALLSAPAAASEPIHPPSASGPNEPTGPQASTSSQPYPLPAPFEVPEDMTPPLGSLLTRAKAVWSFLPVTCPIAFRSSLSGKGRAGEDLKKAYRRYWLSIYLIGTFHLNATLEIDDLLAMTGGLSSRAGSLSRIMDELVDSRILSSETLRINIPRTSLRLVRLSSEGRRLFQTLFDKEPLEGDWESLVQTRGEVRFLEPNLATLILAMHARKRGWATRVLPPVENAHTLPDLLVLKDSEKWFLTLELDQKGNQVEWEKRAKLNRGKVALCAATPAAREGLAEACRRKRLPGLATDLETLIRARYGNITDQTPLWAESW